MANRMDLVVFWEGLEDWGEDEAPAEGHEDTPARDVLPLLNAELWRVADGRLGELRRVLDGVAAGDVRWTWHGPEDGLLASVASVPWIEPEAVRVVLGGAQFDGWETYALVPATAGLPRAWLSLDRMIEVDRDFKRLLAARPR